jgi:hypothetical protein
MIVPLSIACQRRLEQDQNPADRLRKMIYDVTFVEDGEGDFDNPMTDTLYRNLVISAWCLVIRPLSFVLGHSSFLDPCCICNASSA